MKKIAYIPTMLDKVSALDKSEDDFDFSFNILSRHSNFRFNLQRKNSLGFFKIKNFSYPLGIRKLRNASKKSSIMYSLSGRSSNCDLDLNSITEFEQIYYAYAMDNEEDDFDEDF